MATKAKPSDGKLVFIKFARVLTYFVYGYCLVASVFLAIGTFLLMFSANTSSNFVQFIYSGAENFLQPFRGIFPPKQISESGYFSTSAVFAIIIYMLIALSVHSLISWITVKMVAHKNELVEAHLEAQKLAEQKAAAERASQTRPPAPRSGQPKRTI